MNFINLNCPPLPYFIVGGGCVYRPGDIHERRTIRNVFDLIYVHSGTLYLEQDPFRIELNAGQFFIITPDTRTAAAASARKRPRRAGCISIPTANTACPMNFTRTT